MALSAINCSFDREKYERLYLSGQLSEEDTKTLRDCLNLSSWESLKKQRQDILMAPVIADLKERFPEASTVYLKGGSPTLVVEWTRNDGLVSVVWFAEGVTHRDSFHPDALQTSNIA